MILMNAIKSYNILQKPQMVFLIIVFGIMQVPRKICKINRIKQKIFRIFFKQNLLTFSQNFEGWVFQKNLEG